LTETGLTTAHLLHTPGPETIPTLSLRTLALTTNPLTHLKLPINTATLGNRNTRTITPGSLTDTATGHQLIQHIATTTNNHHILHANEQGYAHANHPLLACLARQLPTTITNSLVLPLAALTATTPTIEFRIDDHLGTTTNPT
ncbi:IucA/IucC family protein, partial [Dermatophilus congolensis]|uniref:IucA/IucC family protein n=1 Tax=Dermatophilus congolensis TaxID=1863 RepID=UPI001AB04649